MSCLINYIGYVGYYYYPQLLFIAYMKILYLIKEKGNFSKTVKDIMDAQISEGNEITLANLYEGDVDYGVLIDNIFKYDRVICF